MPITGSTEMRFNEPDKILKVIGHEIFEKAQKVTKDANKWVLIEDINYCKLAQIYFQTIDKEETNRTWFTGYELIIPLFREGKIEYVWLNGDGTAHDIVFEEEEPRRLKKFSYETTTGHYKHLYDKNSLTLNNSYIYFKQLSDPEAAVKKGFSPYTAIDRGKDSYIEIVIYPLTNQNNKMKAARELTKNLI